MLAGKPGVSKTTLALDLVFHLASGRGWLGLPVRRPLNVLVVENEGPIQMFQAKLKHKAERWDHPIGGGVHVHTWRWGSLDLADPDTLVAVGGYLDRHDIDVVVADPLNTLGVQGVGSPEDTRGFVRTGSCGRYTRSALQQPPRSCFCTTSAKTAARTSWKPSRRRGAATSTYCSP